MRTAIGMYRGTGPRQTGTTMERDELLVQMISRSAELRNFGDWVDILGKYADCLAQVGTKLAPDEMERFLNVGATFYRTLARAEDYRLNTLPSPRG